MIEGKWKFNMWNNEHWEALACKRCLLVIRWYHNQYSNKKLQDKYIEIRFSSFFIISSLIIYILINYFLSAAQYYSSFYCTRMISISFCIATLKCSMDRLISSIAPRDLYCPRADPEGPYSLRDAEIRQMGCTT